MPNRYVLIAIALLSWTLFGILIITTGAYFILGYGQIQNLIAFGASFGAVLGLVVGTIAVSPVVSANRISTYRWALPGSMIGALIGLGLLHWLGGFPTRTQADLSLVFLGPGSLAIGAISGMVIAVWLEHIWRSR